jgi:hypothetical protein
LLWNNVGCLLLPMWTHLLFDTEEKDVHAVRQDLLTAQIGPFIS